MIRSRFFLSAFCCLVLCHTAQSWSDDPPKSDAAPDPCKTDLTLEKLDNPPERKTKFEVEEEVVKQRLVDVKAAENRFVAVIRILLPKETGAPFPGDIKIDWNRDVFGRTASSIVKKDSDLSFLWLQAFRQSYLLDPKRTTDDMRARESFATVFERMLEHIPPDRLPQQHELFTSPEIDRSLMSSWSSAFSSSLKGARNEHQLHLFAASAKQAEERARALIAILDQGFSRPIQTALFKERMKECEYMRATREKHADARKHWEALTARLKEYDEFTPDMLAGLRVQQLQLEVDLAGVKAKIATCEKLLGTMTNAERRKQIEDAKIAAEIELSGFEARRAKSAEFVAKLKERNELTLNQVRAGGQMQSQKDRVDSAIRAIRTIDEEIAAFAPVRLVDDRVTIHPLEWTQ